LRMRHPRIGFLMEIVVAIVETNNVNHLENFLKQKKAQPQYDIQKMYTTGIAILACLMVWFLQLTDKEYLPESKIGPVDAMALLDLERRIIGYNSDEELSSLQNRLVNAVARGKKEDFRPLRKHKQWLREFEQNT
jgi:hypothetical protein